MTEIKLSDIFKSKLLIDKINREQLSVFLESQNLYAYRDKNKNEKLEYLLENIKKENIEEANTLLENTDEFYTLHDNFSIFLSEQAKYTSNRTIITTPVNLSSNSPLFNTNEFNKRFPNYMEYNNVSLIDDEELETSLNESPGRYFQFFEKKIESNGQINLVSKGFVSKKKQRTRPHQDEADIIVNPLLDFVWVDIYPQKKYYRIHISERLPSTEGQLSFEEIYNLFSQKIEDEFNLIPAEHSGANVLYKMYKFLTMNAESSYVTTVANFESKITSFVEEISVDINYSDENVNGIELNTRLVRLLERAIIQQDFQNYVTQTDNRDGFVDKFQYQDPTGGRVFASSNDASYDMSKHDIYFDTKETIDINKTLNTLWLRWFKEEIQNGVSTTNQIKVRYENYSRYYITHFLYSHVSKEECDYVLPKFDEYEARSVD